MVVKPDGDGGFNFLCFFLVSFYYLSLLLLFFYVLNFFHIAKNGPDICGIIVNFKIWLGAFKCIFQVK